MKHDIGVNDESSPNLHILQHILRALTRIAACKRWHTDATSRWCTFVNLAIPGQCYHGTFPIAVRWSAYQDFEQGSHELEGGSGTLCSVVRADPSEYQNGASCKLVQGWQVAETSDRRTEARISSLRVKILGAWIPTQHHCNLREGFPSNDN